MSQHDFNIANQSFPSFRSDLNDALVALASLSSGATEPATTYAHQLWYDTSTNYLKYRNATNSGWIVLFQITATGIEAVNGFDVTGDIAVTGQTRGPDGSATVPTYSNTGDGNTGVYFPAADTIGFSVGGSNVARVTTDGVLSGKTAPSISTVGAELAADGSMQSTRSGGNPLALNRTASDGSLIIFFQDGINEGNITINGTAVSLTGGHLARWAQFPDGSRPELLKGTVMSNLDKMSAWGDEDNEQLNCVQISAVEGDANVAGVFVAWDSEDDGYNDILLGMTGDMVIRIAAGTTVARGDLLMSAGDGTAKPQGDDIVRSKTIAKVTSIHVSHTYADGSYAVPCVLMAC